jgi:hypothetical protein
MYDFLPPWKQPPPDADPWIRCLYRVESYDVWVRRGEGITYLHFTPQEKARCGLEPRLNDPGASYAISDQGVIMKRE